MPPDLDRLAYDEEPLADDYEAISAHFLIADREQESA